MTAGNRPPQDTAQQGLESAAHAGPRAGQGDAMSASAEAAAVERRYARRDTARDAQRYSLFDAAALAMHQERQRALVRLLARQGWPDLRGARILEVGCGNGGNLLDLLRLGAQAEQLTGLELLPERAAAARARLPAATRIIEGDALAAPVPPASQDIILQATVFSSLLDDAFQQRLADALWRWLAPGGGLLWYDFVFDNPANRDVRGVPLARVRQLFPQGRIVEARRVTLAPPLARAACRLTPALYPLLNALPLLRTHRLLWIARPH